MKKTLINKQTGLIEFTGSYDDCLTKRTELIKEEGGVLSNPDDYYFINEGQQQPAPETIIVNEVHTYQVDLQQNEFYIGIEDENGKDYTLLFPIAEIEKMYSYLKNKPI